MQAPKQTVPVMFPANPHEQFATPSGERLIRFPEYCSITGETRTQAYEKMKAKVAPAPIKDGRASLWVLSEVQAYVERKIAAAQRKA